MGISLKRVELSNFRSHRHIVFEPADSGVTVISGPNGAGKSTIVDSIPWTLYGTKPKGVSKAISFVRDGTDISTEKVFARVTMMVDNSELKIERRIINKFGHVECDIWERKPDEEEFKHVAGSAVSHTEKYIQKRLRMNESGFLAAILVQQKQVDQLISSGAKERAEVIERLTGIASITSALGKAREKYNQIRKVYQMTNIDEGAYDRYVTERKTLSEKYNKRIADRNKLEEEVNTLKNSIKEISESLEQEEAKSSQLEKLNFSLIELNTKISGANEEIEKLLEKKKKKKAQISAMSTGVNIKELEGKISAAKKSLRLKDLEVDKSSSEIAELTKQLENYQNVFSKSNGITQEQAESNLQECEQKLEDIVSKKEDANALIISAQASIKKINSAIKIIEKEEGSCPTCLQEIKDPDDAVNSLDNDKKEQEEAIANAKETLLKANDLEKRTINRQKSFMLLVEAFNVSHSIDSKVEKLVEIKNTSAAEAKALEAEITALDKVFSDAKRHQEISSEYNELLVNSVQLSDKIEQLNAQKNTVETQLKKIGKVSSASISALRTKYNSANEKTNKTFSEFSQSREEVSVMNTQINHLDEKITNAEEEMKRYKELMDTVEAHGKSVEVLEEFREDRIKQSVPVVGVYASDLISRFTEGQFNQLKLDKKFNASVTLANGAERAVGMLSGGELSSAAISLRLAISMLLNSGVSQNMQILDEVLVSQDPMRSEQILGTIKDICRGQVIMISHGSNKNDIADEIFEL